MSHLIDFFVQLFAAVFLFAGLWLMGSKRLAGPFLCFIAEGFTTAVGITHHTWSIILIGVVLFFVQVRNFVKWKKEGAPW
jgi:hypothetical protein